MKPANKNIPAIRNSARQKRMIDGLRDARFLGRIDAPALLVACIAVMALATGGFALARYLENTGYADPEIVRPLPDTRILENIRPASASYVGATALQNGEGTVLAARANGEVVAVQPQSMLIDTETIDLSTGALSGEILEISSGCGWLVPSADQADCPMPDTAFALTSNGGVARRTAAGQWESFIADEAWIGLRDVPVSQGDIETWAASASGRYLALFSPRDGLALFDQHTGRWHIPVDQDPLIAAAKLGAVQIVAQGERFWLGSPVGYGLIDAAANAAPLMWSDPAYNIRDLSRADDGTIWAVTEGPCMEGPETDCLSVQHLTTTTQAEFVMGERSRIADLSMATLAHVAMQGENLVALGSEGIQTYDNDQRSWATLVATPVDAYQARNGGALIVASSDNRLFLIENAAIRKQVSTTGGPFKQVEYISDDLILGLSDGGVVHNLANGAALSFRDATIAPDTVFTAGASLGTQMLALGPDGALVHDVAARRFAWLPTADLPVEMQGANLRILAADGVFWLANDISGAIGTLAVVGDYPDLSVNYTQTGIVNAPLRSVIVGVDALYFVTADGTPGRAVGPIGDARAQLTLLTGDLRVGSGRFIAATHSADGMIFATSSEIWRYDRQARGWTGPASGPKGEAIVALEQADGLFARTQSGRIFRENNGEWSTVLGRGHQAQIPSAAIDDAMSVEGGLYLAGRGRVQRYLPDEAQFSGLWGGNSTQPVRLLAVREALPVWLSGSSLFVGDEQVEGPELINAWPGLGGVVGQARNGATQSFAIHYPEFGAPSCTYFGAPAPTGAFIDGLALADGRYLVSTAASTGVYVPQERRWLQLDTRAEPEDLRYYISGDYLVALTSNTLRSILLISVIWPDSCAPPLADVRWTQSISAQSLAYDETRGTVAILEDNGAVSEWQQGQIRNLMPATDTAPDMASLRRFIATDDRLVFVTDRTVWSYNLTTRIWAEARLMLPEGALPLQELSLYPTDQSVQITAWGQDGQSYGGDWLARFSVAQLAPLTMPNLPHIATPPTEIVEIAARASVWAVGSAQAVEFTSAGEGQQSARISLPEGDDILPLPATLAGNTVLQNAAGTLVYIMPRAQILSGETGALKQVAARYDRAEDQAWGVDEVGQFLWRVTNDGAVLRCAILAGADLTQDCATVFSAPLRVQADSLQLVTPWGDGQWVVLDGELLHLNAQWRDAQPIVGPKPRADAGVFEADRIPYFWEGRGGALWQLGSNVSAEKLAESVTLILPWQGSFLIYSQDGYSELLPDGSVAPVTWPDAEGLQLISLDWRNPEQVIAIDALGQPVLVDGQTPFGPVFDKPGSITAFAVSNPVATDAPRDDLIIWVQRDNGLIEALAIADCSFGSSGGQQCYKTLATTEGGDLGDLRGAEGQTAYFTAGTLVLDEAAPNGLRQRDEVASWRMPEMLANQRDRVLAAGQVEGELVTLYPASFGAVQANMVEVRNATGQLLAQVTQTITPWDAMDLGWMRWLRDERQLSFNQTGGQTLALRPTEAIFDGQVLAALPGRGAYAQTSQNQFTWLSARAIWEVDIASKEPRLMRLLETPAPVALSRDQFLLPDDVAISVQTGESSQTPEYWVHEAGPLSLRENLRQAGIQASLALGEGEPVDVMASTGFSHDIRLAVGWRNGATVLVSPIGIVPLDTLDGIDPLPSVPFGGVAMASNANGDYLRIAAQWWQHSAPDGWVETPDPFASRPIFDELNGARWALDEGEIIATPLADDEAWRVVREGLDFAQDQLIAITATADGVLLVTPLGLQVALDPAEIAAASAPLADVFAPEWLDSLAGTPGEYITFSQNQDDGYIIWDWPSQTWRTASFTQRPWQQRMAVEDSHFRIQLTASTPSQVWRSIDQDTTQRWARMSWPIGGAMPSDHATAMQAHPAGLIIGTDFGWRMLDTTGALQPVLRDMPQTSDLGEADSPAVSISQIGLPMTSGASVSMLSVNQGCATVSDTLALTPCALPVDLSKRLIVTDDLWQWAQSDGAISGTYRGAVGDPLNIPTDPVGAWPHDDLRAALRCGDSYYELWQDGEHLFETEAGQGVLRAFGTANLAGLHCQAMDSALDAGQSVANGTYLLADGQVMRRGVDDWDEIDAALAPEITRRAAGELIFDSAQLRVTLGAIGESYVHLWGDGVWRDMAWMNGLPAADNILAINALPDQIVWLSTLGAMRTPLQSGTYRLNPDNMLFAAEEPGWLDDCEIDRVERQDGQIHGAATLEGEPLVIRCRNGAVYAEQPEAEGDIGRFAPSDTDPFTTRVLIDAPGIWQWTQSHADASAAPHLSAVFRDEDLTLEKGRFGPDSFLAIQAFRPGQLDVVTESGWWLTPQDGPSLFATSRPEGQADAHTVTGLWNSRTNHRAVTLCVTTPQGALQLAPDGTASPAAFCLQDQGFDGLWHYEVGDLVGAVAESRSENDELLGRQLTNGRFVDRMALSAPVSVDISLPQGRASYVVPNTVGLALVTEEGAIIGHIAQANLHSVMISPAGQAVMATPEPATDLLGGFAEICPAYANAQNQLPALWRTHKAEIHGSNLVLFGRLDDQPPTQLRLNCAAAPARWTTLFVDTRMDDRRRYRALMPAEATNQIRLQPHGDALVISDGTSRAITLPLPAERGDIRALVVAQQGNEAFLVTSGDIYVVDMDAAISSLTAADANTPPPMPHDALTQVEAESAAELAGVDAEAAPEVLDENRQIDIEAATSAVRQTVQRSLNRAVQAGLNVDGVYSEAMRDAIAEYQDRINAETTGILTASQYRKLTFQAPP